MKNILRNSGFISPTYNIISRALPLLSGIMLFVVFWHYASVQVDKPYLPRPHEVFASIVEEMQDDLLDNTLISTYRVIISITIGVAIAAPLAILAAQFRLLDKFLTPLIYFAYPAPKVVFLPLIISFLGLGDASRIFLITLIIFFQVFVIIRDAAGQIPVETIESISSLGAGHWHILRYVYIPVSIPAIMTALKISAGTAIAVLFITETIAGNTGLGYYIVNEWSIFSYDTMFAGIIAMSMLGLGLFSVFATLEHILTRWQRR
jgi:ABC-type nitrate/sulfonate/bicarbonate transport system permease component